MTKINLEYKKDCCSFCGSQKETVYMSGNEEIVCWQITPHDMTGDCYYLEDGCLYAIADDPYCRTGPLKINYCPVCGRILKEVYKINEIKKDFE